MTLKLCVMAGLSKRFVALIIVFLLLGCAHQRKIEKELNNITDNTIDRTQEIEFCKHDWDIETSICRICAREYRPIKTKKKEETTILWIFSDKDAVFLTAMVEEPIPTNSGLVNIELDRLIILWEFYKKSDYASFKKYLYIGNVLQIRHDLLKKWLERVKARTKILKRMEWVKR